MGTLVGAAEEPPRDSHYGVELLPALFSYLPIMGAENSMDRRNAMMQIEIPTGACTQKSATLLYWPKCKKAPQAKGGQLAYHGIQFAKRIAQTEKNRHH